MKKSVPLQLLDRVLLFAAEHTDAAGRMVVEREIDCKDPGWLILSGVIRGLEHGWQCGPYDLLALCRRWTAAAVDTDDSRSAWTTFALLYALHLSGGPDGIFRRSMPAGEQRAFDRFIMQIDMKYLREASKNYQVAAGFIDALRLRFGYLAPGENDVPPDDSVKIMLDGYLGDGFFNDDDIRGSRADRRIDAYSAEIIGLLLHYDEIHDWKSVWHDRIEQIVRDFCAANLLLIDARGEYAKWGRSLRGEAEVKKVFIWEYAESRGLTARPGDGAAASAAQLAFFLRHGLSPDGQIAKDKAANRGIWDEYTTHVQAQGYGAYGLAMTVRFATGKEEAAPLPSSATSYLKYLPGPRLIAANDAATGVHYVVPLLNRLTKPMYLWHNRITGENDVEVDMSAKFMPLPYFGLQFPAPYAGPELPLLPLLEDGDGMLVPRNLDPSPVKAQTEDDRLVAVQEFRYCRPGTFVAANEIGLQATLSCRSNGLAYELHFTGPIPPETGVVIRFFTGPAAECAVAGTEARIVADGVTVDWRFRGLTPQWREERGGPSIYGPETPALAACLPLVPELVIPYELSWKRTEK